MNQNYDNENNQTRAPRRRAPNRNTPRYNESNEQRPVSNRARPAQKAQPSKVAPQYDDYDDYDDYADQPQNHNNYQQRRNPPEKSNKPLIIGGVAALVVIGAGALFLLNKPASAQIVSVSPNYVTTQQAYQDCHRVSTTKYVKNKKNGTEGAIIGGATGAVAGGIIGNQVKQGGGGTVIGAVAGGAAGALIGDQVQKSNQPDYVAHKGSGTQCRTAYKPVQNQVGYNVQYLYKDNMQSIVTQTAPAIGSKIPLDQLQAMAVPAAQLNPSQQPTSN